MICLEGPSPLRLSTGDLKRLLESAEIVRREHTSIAGTLRVLELGGVVYVQEESPEGQILLRPRPSLEAAMVFVDGRLLAYERMWDG